MFAFSIIVPELHRQIRTTFNLKSLALIDCAFHRRNMDSKGSSVATNI